MAGSKLPLDLSMEEKPLGLVDLDLAIETARRALFKTPSDKSAMSDLLADLGSQLHLRYKQQGKHEDLVEAISWTRQAVERLSDDRSMRMVSYQEDLADQLESEFKWSRYTPELDESIGLTRRAIDLTGHRDNKRTMSLYAKLRNRLQLRLEYGNKLGDLLEEIKLTRQTIKITTDKSSSQTSYLLNHLASQLISRFDRLNRLSDLEEGIAITRYMIDITADRDAMHKSCLLNNLGNQLQLKFDRLGKVADLKEAIEVSLKAAEVTPNGGVVRARYLKYLVDKNHKRCEQLSSLLDQGKVLVESPSAFQEKGQDQKSIGSEDDPKLQGDDISIKEPRISLGKEGPGYISVPSKASQYEESVVQPPPEDDRSGSLVADPPMPAFRSSSPSLRLSSQACDEFIVFLANEFIWSIGSNRTRLKDRADIVEGLKDAMPNLLASLARHLLDEMDDAVPSDLDELNRVIVRLIKQRCKDITREFQMNLVSGWFVLNTNNKTIVDAFEQFKPPPPSRRSDSDASPNVYGVNALAKDNTDVSRELPPPLRQLQRLIVQSNSYENFIEEIKGHLFPTRKDAMGTLKNEIESMLAETERISTGKGAHAMQQIDFSIISDLSKFLNKNYRGGKFQNLHNILTLTGNATDAEAVTCAAYMERVWPETGLKILEAVQAALQSDSKTWRSFSTSSTLAWIALTKTSSILKATVYGSTSAIVQVAQQLAWIGAACRSPSLRKTPSPQQVVETTTLINSFKSSDAVPEFVLAYWDEIAQQSKNGSCWNAMFEHATIARGFPFSERHHGETGLEINTGIMIDLCSTPYAAAWNNGYVLKGFSAMLIPTAQISGSNSVQWHLIHDPNGERVPYHSLDSFKRCSTEEVPLDMIETSRAFLGWCSTVDCCIGTSRVPCNPGFSGLDECGPGYGFSSLSISCGQLVSISGTATKGQKDKAIHITRETCFVKLVKDLKRSNIVLYETKGRRAFLVDGAQALLHLLRAGLESQDYQVKSDALDYSNEAETEKSVAKFLLNSANLRLIEDKRDLEDGKSEHYYLRNLIFKTWYTIELLRDHESAVKFRGLEIPSSWHHVIFGWEFMAIAKEKWSLQLKHTAAKASAAGWIALVRETKALVLFAHDFGDIYLPKPSEDETDTVCKSYERLPSNKDLIAIHNSFLEEMYEETGCERSRERLTNSRIGWYQRGHPFKPCRLRNCDEVVQELHYDTFFNRHIPRNNLRPPQELSATGAVIFGWAGSKFPWFGQTHRDDPILQDGENNEAEGEAEEEAEGASLSAQESPTTSQSTPPSSISYPIRGLESSQTSETKSESLLSADSHSRSSQSWSSQMETLRPGDSQSDSIQNIKGKGKISHNLSRLFSKRKSGAAEE